jgi:hypothetical protein
MYLWDGIKPRPEILIRYFLIAAFSYFKIRSKRATMKVTQNLQHK